MSKNDMHITLSEAEKYLSINKVTSNDTGNYSCVATNGSITNFKNVNLIVMGTCDKIFKCFIGHLFLCFDLVIIFIFYST